jgi:hypothetical protein
VEVLPDTAKESKEVRIMLNSYSKNILFIILTIVLSDGAIFAQTSGFTYQGRLTDGGTPANGNYDLQFALFDAAGGSNQIGQIQTIPNVAVSAGVFTVTLDFGASAFSGANRFLEISARPSGAGAFTLLTPRQPITATPYALRSLNTANADTATNAQQLAGVSASQYVKTDDSRMSDARPPTTGSSNYIQNATSPQASSNFNISGNGTAGGTLSASVVNATQYNVNGSRAFSITGGGSWAGSNTFAGAGAGVLTTPNAITDAGNLNSFFGGGAGTLNTNGRNNSFFGSQAGARNTTGYNNTSVGASAGFFANTTGNNNTFIGYGADGPADITNATAIGATAKVTQSNSLVLGDVGINVGIGTSSPTSKLQVVGTVESTTGGFKFPDGSVQTNAVGKVITTGVGLPEMEIGAFSNDTTINTLSLPRGTYLVTATVSFQNRASDVFANNTRLVLCQLANDLLWYNRLGAKNDPMDRITVTMHSVRVHTGTASVSLTCRAIDGGQVFVTARRLTAVRLGDNPETQ